MMAIIANNPCQNSAQLSSRTWSFSLLGRLGGCSFAPWPGRDHFPLISGLFWFNWRKPRLHGVLAKGLFVACDSSLLHGSRWENWEEGDSHVI